MAILGKKRWGRRVGTAIAWAALAFGSINLQPTLGTDVSLLTIVIEKSAYIAIVLILGITGTDAMKMKNAGN